MRERGQSHILSNNIQDMENNKNQTAGCDKTSRVYNDTYNVLKELMKNDERIKTLNPLDHSAVGLYIGKFVEQEINSSVVQLMRHFCGIDMPEYYCKLYPQYDTDTNVTVRNRTIRLNEHKDPRSNFHALKTVALGDAFAALKVLKEEDNEGFFDEYPWLSDKVFLEAWRNLYQFRNMMAHTGEIIDEETLKKNDEYFHRFLKFMPNILELKKKLAPEDYIESLPTAREEREEVKRPYLESTDNPERPYATKEVAKRFCELQEEMASSDDSHIIEEINGIIEKYSLDAIIFSGSDGKKGMKDCLGNILVPARYDGFDFLPKPLEHKRSGVIAVRDGHFVVVALDGTGKELTKETYDEIRLASYGNLSSPYIYRKNGLMAWGFMNLIGEELTDCIADVFCDQSMYAYYQSGGLWGYWEYNSKTLLPPIYDNIESEDEAEGLLIFTLNGEQGYVKHDGTFVSFSELEKMDDDAQWDIRCECINDPLMDY